MTRTPETEPAPASQPAVGGWHWAEWAAEAAGVAFLLAGGFSLVGLVFAPASPVARAVPSRGLGLLVVGAGFGTLAMLVAISPVGRRSGAHLNPAVTFAFWLRRHVHPHDLAGYIGGQVVGAVAGTAVYAGLLGRWATQTDLASTRPATSVPAWGAALIETALTAVLVFVILAFVSSRRTARLTPFAVIPVLAMLIRVGAPYTGASMNPARTLAPDLLLWRFPDLWLYVVGPVAGAALGVAAWTLLFGRRLTTLTAKLFHDHRYPTTLRSVLPARPAGSTPR